MSESEDLLMTSVVFKAPQLTPNLIEIRFPPSTTVEAAEHVFRERHPACPKVENMRFVFQGRLLPQEQMLGQLEVNGDGKLVVSVVMDTHSPEMNRRDLLEHMRNPQTVFHRQLALFYFTYQVFCLRHLILRARAQRARRVYHVGEDANVLFRVRINLRDCMKTCFRIWVGVLVLTGELAFSLPGILVTLFIGGITYVVKEYLTQRRQQQQARHHVEVQTPPQEVPQQGDPHEQPDQHGHRSLMDVISHLFLSLNPTYRVPVS
eukprot:TRINITY_DN5900_c0_g2_i1.p1 TRINITY_DN5900_c0_g2~~TRINITY_DN5900_c0_g2_i1.p1  ORF type:complete len:263 (+),score=38.06 TRINITY_DN5900_c0_g2_i1:108-896(+)